MAGDERIESPQRHQLKTRGDSLVILAYRCWQAGFDYSDAERWQYAWVALSNEFGPVQARPILSAIEDFVRGLRQVSVRQIDYYPPPCCRASHSEQVILELIAALQAGEPFVGHWIEALCGDLPDASAARVLKPARALASSLLDAGIAVLADRPARAARPPFKHLH